MKVPQAWVGKTLSQLDLRKLYSINVLGKRNPHTHKLEVPVDPNLEIELNDTFLVLAQTDEIEKYDYLLSYDMNPAVHLVHLVYRILGFELTSKILMLYIKKTYYS